MIYQILTILALISITLSGQSETALKSNSADFQSLSLDIIYQLNKSPELTHKNMVQLIKKNCFSNSTLMQKHIEHENLIFYRFSCSSRELEKNVHEQISLEKLFLSQDYLIWINEEQIITKVAIEDRFYSEQPKYAFIPSEYDQDQKALSFSEPNSFSIPRDKKLHFVAGSLLSYITAEAVYKFRYDRNPAKRKKATAIGFGAAVLTGAGKEIYDYLCGCGTPEFLDFVATSAGGAVGVLTFRIRVQ